jgi:hypothetical protein
VNVNGDVKTSGKTMPWTKTGDGTPESPETWTSPDGRNTIEKHPFTNKWMLLRDGEMLYVTDMDPTS